MNLTLNVVLKQYNIYSVSVVIILFPQCKKNAYIKRTTMRDVNIMGSSQPVVIIS